MFPIAHAAADELNGHAPLLPSANRRLGNAKETRIGTTKQDWL